MENMNLSVTLTAAQWNTVLSMLAQGPFNQVAVIIAEIRKQGDAALQAAQTQTSLSQEEPAQE